MESKDAFLFPGQGSQYVGMGRDLWNNFPVAHDVFAQANDVLGVALSEICFEGPPEVLNDTFNTQPAILTVSIAALRALQEKETELPDYVAGHSMGEFSALVASGALTFEDGLNLVRERGRLMKQAGEQSPGGMAAILGLPRDEMEIVCARTREQSGAYVGVANDNCPGQVVISGACDALKQAMTLATEHEAKRAIPLPVSIAAHSPLMDGITSTFKHRLAATPIRNPQIPLVANATARPVTDPDDIRKALGCQLTSPVRWTESVEWMIAQGVRRFVEIGPKEVISGLVRRIDRSVERTSTEEILA